MYTRYIILDCPINSGVGDLLHYDKLLGTGTAQNGKKYTRKKQHLQINKRKKERKKHVWLSGRMHIEGQLNEGPRLQRKYEDENEAKQNKRNTRERRHDICKPTARRIQVRTTCG